MGRETECLKREMQAEGKKGYKATKWSRQNHGKEKKGTRSMAMK